MEKQKGVFHLDVCIVSCSPAPFEASPLNPSADLVACSTDTNKGYWDRLSLCTLSKGTSQKSMIRQRRWDGSHLFYNSVVGLAHFRPVSLAKSSLASTPCLLALSGLSLGHSLLLVHTQQPTCMLAAFSQGSVWELCPLLGEFDLTTICHIWISLIAQFQASLQRRIIAP